MAPILVIPPPHQVTNQLAPDQRPGLHTGTHSLQTPTEYGKKWLSQQDICHMTSGPTSSGRSTSLSDIKLFSPGISADVSNFTNPGISYK